MKFDGTFGNIIHRSDSEETFRRSVDRRGPLTRACRNMQFWDSFSEVSSWVLFLSAARVHIYRLTATT